MSQFELTSSPTSAAKPRPTSVEPKLSPPTVRDIARLMADIRRARALLESAAAFEQPASTPELVVACDPRD